MADDVTRYDFIVCLFHEVVYDTIYGRIRGQSLNIRNLTSDRFKNLKKIARN